MNEEAAPDREAPAQGQAATGAEARESPAKRKRIRLILGIAAIIVLVGGVAWFIRHRSYGQYQQSTEDAYFQADTVAVSARVPGYVEQVLVRSDENVKAGQPLLRIDVRDFSAQAAQGQAQIDLAGANAENARAMIREQEAAIDQAQAMLGVAQSKASFAEGEVARYRPLAASGAEPREKLAQLQAQATQAEQDAAAQKAALEIARRRIAALQAQVSQAQAQERSARAQTQAAQVNVGSALVRASTAGRVGDLTARAGQYVQPGQRLMSIVPVDQLYLEANFKETQVGLMRPGQPVRIEVDALPGIEIRGRVASIAPGTGAQFSLLPPQNATGNFTKIVQRVPVRIAIDADPVLKRALIPGLSVEVTVDTRSGRDELEQLHKLQDAHQAARQ
jgi:Multidrug resistance efflux pump